MENYLIKILMTEYQQKAVEISLQVRNYVFDASCDKVYIKKTLAEEPAS
jgi:hypothetical protein